MGGGAGHDKNIFINPFVQARISFLACTSSVAVRVRCVNCHANLFSWRNFFDEKMKASLHPPKVGLL